MRTPIREEQFEHIEINGKPALFTNNRIAYTTVYKYNDWQSHSYVALCGLSEQAMLKQLDNNENLTTVVLCLDNDTAGNKAADKFENLLVEREIALTRLLPTLKDFNEDLQALVREPKQEIELKMA